MVGSGIEPLKAELADLQSRPSHLCVCFSVSLCIDLGVVSSLKCLAIPVAVSHEIELLRTQHYNDASDKLVHYYEILSLCMHSQFLELESTSTQTTPCSISVKRKSCQLSPFTEV